MMISYFDIVIAHDVRRKVPAAKGLPNDMGARHERQTAKDFGGDLHRSRKRIDQMARHRGTFGLARRPDFGRKRVTGEVYHRGPDSVSPPSAPVARCEA